MSFTISRHAFVLLLYVTGCGGRSVDLDTPPDPNPGGGGANAAAAPSRVLSKNIYDFTQDSDRLYWSEYLTTEIQSCSKTNCSRTIVGYGKGWGSRLTASSGYVYWTPQDSTSSVVTCLGSGCVGKPRTLVQEASLPGGAIAADGDYFYWQSAYDLYRCPNAGCGATPEVVAAEQRGTTSMSFQDDFVYWEQDTYDNDGNVKASRLFRAPKDGSEAPRILFATTGAEGSPQLPVTSLSPFALDARRVYWIDQNAHVVACPLSGCEEGEPQVVVATNPRKSQLAVDSTGVYWVQSEFGYTNALRYCSFAACERGESTVLIDHTINHYLIDDANLYFTESTNDGNYPAGIQRMSKPTL